MGGKRETKMKSASCVLVISAIIGCVAQSDMCKPIHKQCPEECPPDRSSLSAMTFDKNTAEVKKLFETLQGVLMSDKELASNVIMVDKTKYVKMTLQPFCCHTLEEEEAMTVSVQKYAFPPLQNQALGVISCAPVADVAGQRSFPEGSHALEVGLDAVAHKEMLQLVRMVRHYSSKETGIKIEPRVSKFALRLAVVNPDFDMPRALSKLQEALDGMSAASKALPQVTKYQLGSVSIRPFLDDTL